MILTYLYICMLHNQAVPIPPNQNPPQIITSWDILRSWVSPFEQIWSAYLPHWVKFQLHLEALSSVVASLASPVLCHGFWYLGCACIENLGGGVLEVWNGWMYKNYLQITFWIHFQPYEQVMLGNWNSYLSLADDQLVIRANLRCFVLFKLSLHNRQFLHSQSLLAASHRFHSESTS